MSNISVILLSTHLKHELKRALEYVGEQTEVPSQMIIVDAMKDSESYDYVKEVLPANTTFVSYQANDFPEEENSKSFNSFHMIQTGMKYVTGDYVAILDSKDVWNTDVLAAYQDAIDNESEADIILSCFSRRAEGTTTFNPEFGRTDSSGQLAFAQLLDAPSSVILKYSVGICLDVVDLSQIKVGYINKCLTQIYSITYGKADRLEKDYWNCYSDVFRRKSMLYPAVQYAIKAYQHTEVERASFLIFADSVHLSARDSADILYGEPKAAAVDEEERSRLNNEIQKKQRNYILMRNWVESKLANRSILDKIRELTSLDQGKIRVAIYGAGKHGSILFDELSNYMNDLDITCWIEANPKSDMLKCIPVYRLDSLDDTAIDVVIVSPYQEYETIKTNIAKFTSAKTLSLDELFQ